MTKSRRFTQTSGLLLGVLLAAGNTIAAPMARAQGEKTAAIVNGEIITEQDFFERLQRLHGQAFLNGNNQLRPESAGLLILDAMITERLILQAANKAKVAVPEEEVNADLDNLKKQPQVVAGLTGHLFTEEMLKNDIRIQGARFKLATLGVKVSPQEVEKYYKAHIAEYTIPEQWGLSIIKTSNPDTSAKIDADLKAGKSFADTAKLYSDDPATKDKGGDAGSIAANDTRIQATLRDAVRPLKPGDISPTVRLETDAGPGKAKVVTWWRLLLKSKQPESVRPLDELKTGVERLALIEKAGGYQAGDKKVADLRGQSDIKVSLPGYDVLQSRR
jgi:peptidyl-prolyl cis-trans isomerase SurA